MNSVFKTDRSHSEVGDTLRYFNSVSTSRSWCSGGGGVGGDEGLVYCCSDLLGGSCKANTNTTDVGYFRRFAGRKGKSRSNSTQGNTLNAPSSDGVCPIRNNSIAGYQFDRM